MPHKSELLSKPELRGLYELYQQQYKYTAALKAEHPLAEHIEYPKFPVKLSEGMITHLIADGKLLSEVGPFREVTVNQKNTADIVAVSELFEVAIEVKATSKDFITMGPKDYRADYFFWLRIENELCIIIQCEHLLENINWKTEKARVHLKDLKKGYTGELRIHEIPLAEVLDDND